MKSFFQTLLYAGLLLAGPRLRAAPSVSETFPSDPVAGNRFTQVTLGTESSFTYNAGNQNLTAVLDVDHDAAYYLSAPFTPITAFGDASFSFKFRIVAIDSRVLPTAFLGLVTTNPAVLADGLTMTLSSDSNGVPAFSATVYQGTANGGGLVPLALATDYLAIGRYVASNRQFSVEVYAGANYANLIGRSTAYATNAPNFGLDRIGLQNSGAKTFDYSNGAISLVIDDIFLPANPPVNLILSTNVVVDEGNLGNTNAVFAVALSSPSVQTVRVDYVTVPLTATPGLDFVPQSGTLIFPPGTNSLGISIPIIGDILAEPDEFFKVVLTNAVNANLVATEGLGTIRNDDICKISINDTAINELPSGQSAVVFTVSLNRTNSQAVSVQLATAELSASAGTDYLATNGLLTFPPGVVTRTFAVTVLGDNLDEPNEVFLVNLSNPTNAIIDRTPGLCVITNTSPPPLVSVDSNTTIIEGNVGTTNGVITFRLAVDSGKTVFASYATSNATAIAGSDYQTVTGTLAFNPGQTIATAAIPVLSDRVHEAGTETFVVRMLAVSNAVPGNSVATVTIVDDDPIPTIDLVATGVKEGDTGTTNAIFAVRLSNPTVNPVTVHFTTTTNGTATAGIDFIATNGVLTWAAESTNAQFLAVPVIGDQLNEPDETIEVILDSPTNAILGRSQVLGTIINDDLVTVSISDGAVVEGNSGTTNMVFQVTLSGLSAQPVSVGYVTKDGTATSAGNDYLATSGLITFTTNTSQTITIAVLGDISDEPDEAFSVVLTNLVNATFLKPTGLGTIINDDPPVIFAGKAEVVEGNTGLTNLCFSLHLTTSRNTNVSARYFTVDGVAKAGQDYLATNGTVVFPPGATHATICIPVAGDTVYEADEPFFVFLTTGINGVITNAQVPCLIINDDLPPGLTVSDVMIVEGNSGTTQAVFNIQVPTKTELGIDVTFNTVDVSASAGFDYLPTNGVFHFDPGVTNLAVAVAVIGDTLDEPDESFLLRLSNPVNATLAKADGVGIIIDDDAPEIRVSNPSVLEGNSGKTQMLFMVTLSTSNAAPVSVSYFTAPGGAAAGTDYISTNGVLSFPPGTISQTVAVQVIGDTLTELNETLLLLLTNAVNGTLPLSGGTGTILDDDAPCLSVANIVVQEPAGGPTNAIFLVTLDKPSSLPVSVSYSTADGSAVAGSDYLGQSGALIFSNGVTSLSLTNVVNNDLVVEGDETFFIDFSNPSNVTLCTSRVTATILDGTVPPVITVNNVTLFEGGAGITNAIFPVTLDRASPQTIKFDFRAVGGSASLGTDFAATSGTTTFLPGVTSNYFVVPVIGDCNFEPQEEFRVNLTNALFAVVATNQVRGLILNDDPQPTVFINNVAVTEGDVGTTNAGFNLRLSCPSAFAVSVQYATVGGTATEGVDYLGTNGTVIFPAGEINAWIIVPVIGDFDDEANETFLVRLSSPVGANLSASQAIGTIVNDDGILIRIGSTQANEGSFAHFVVTLSKPPSSSGISVAYATADDIAVAGQDYVATNGVLHFQAGSTNADRTIVVYLQPDNVDEPNETFFVVLTDPIHATVETNRAVGTIIDGDPPCISILDTSITDNGSGNQRARFPLVLSSASSLPICFSYYTTNSTAVGGLDYLPAAGSLCFPPGTTNSEISVAMVPNTLDETNEFFYVVLYNQTNATICKAKGTSTIINPFVSNLPPVVTLTAPVSGDCVTVPTNITLRVAASDLDGKVNRVAFFNHTNLLGESYEPPFQWTWINVPLGHHLLTAVALDNVGAFATSGPVAFSASLPADLSINSQSVVEGNTGTTNAVFLVNLAAPSCRTVVVEVVTVDGSALAGSDYQAVRTNLTFLPDELQKAVRVWVFGDSFIETNETFYLMLTNEVNAVVTSRLGTGTIISDDTNVLPSVSIVSPVNGAVFYLPTGIIPIVAQAQDLNGFVRQVEFYSGSTFIGRSTNSPFSVPWTAGLAGAYDLTAIVTDNDGARVTSTPVTVTVVACSGNLSATPLTNQTACVCGAATFSTKGSSPDPMTFLWRLNGQLIPAQTNDTITLTGLSAGHAGIISVEVRTPCTSLTNTATLQIEGENLSNPVVFSNPGALIIADMAPAVPYPFPIHVQCVPGLITKLTVTLNGLHHDFPGDIDLLLVSPDGKALKLMSDVGENGATVTNLTLTLDDSAASQLPANTPFLSGNYQPTDYNGGDNDNFAVSPLLPVSLSYVTNLAAFSGSLPSGTWNLCVMDDANLDAGGLEGGWSIAIWYHNAPPPRLTSPVVLADGRFQMALTSQPGSTHAVEVSSDLTHWSPISTFVMVGTNMTLTLPGPLAFPGSFYRVLKCP